MSVDWNDSTDSGVIPVVLGVGRQRALIRFSPSSLKKKTSVLVSSGCKCHLRVNLPLDRAQAPDGDLHHLPTANASRIGPEEVGPITL